jgi:hypothetical protein
VCLCAALPLPHFSITITGTTAGVATTDAVTAAATIIIIFVCPHNRRRA